MAFDLLAAFFVAALLTVLPSNSTLRLAARPYVGGVSHVPPVRARMLLEEFTSLAISSAVLLQAAAFLESLLLSALTLSRGLNPVECSLMLARSDM